MKMVLTPLNSEAGVCQPTSTFEEVQDHFHVVTVLLHPKVSVSVVEDSVHKDRLALKKGGVHQKGAMGYMNSTGVPGGLEVSTGIVGTRSSEREG
jgi:hypothetical protein